MSYLFETREIGDYRISVYQDDDAECPVSAWDMAGLFIWDDGGCGWNGHRISIYGNCEKLFGKYDKEHHTIGEALMVLIREYVPQKKLLAYLKKGGLKNVTMEYNRYNREWELACYDQYYAQFTPKDLRDDDIRAELVEYLNRSDLTQIVKDLAKEIAFCEWSSRGYGQGDFVQGFAWCDEKRFSKYCDTNTQDWRKRALKLFEGEAEDIGHWLWGDVKGYVLEKKVPNKKVFAEIGRETEDGYDWEEVDSCWGEYMETEELIEEVIKENGLDKKDAA